MTNCNLNRALFALEAVERRVTAGFPVRLVVQSIQQQTDVFAKRKGKRLQLCRWWVWPIKSLAIMRTRWAAWQLEHGLLGDKWVMDVYGHFGACRTSATSVCSKEAERNCNGAHDVAVISYRRTLSYVRWHGAYALMRPWDGCSGMFYLALTALCHYCTVPGLSVGTYTL